MIAAEPLAVETFLAAVRYDAQGLVPAIVQDATTHEVLMMAWMNEESLRRTLQVGETVFWSRSRQAFWHKGDTSGHTQRVVDLRIDCDGDTLLVRVDPAGPACHTGAVSCFFRNSPVPAWQAVDPGRPVTG
jgi:phosphoribosyl-ATP pyrophosphohydrolase/phosphoribosyl-AMP cyclohydrolase